jgi:AraC-like DNA-binding protein
MRPEDRLTERQLASARRLLAAGYTYAVVAQRFGCSPSCLRRNLEGQEKAA